MQKVQPSTPPWSLGHPPDTLKSRLETSPVPSLAPSLHMRILSAALQEAAWSNQLPGSHHVSTPNLEEPKGHHAPGSTSSESGLCAGDIKVQSATLQESIWSDQLPSSCHVPTPDPMPLAQSAPLQNHALGTNKSQAPHCVRQHRVTNSQALVTPQQAAQSSQRVIMLSAQLIPAMLGATNPKVRTYGVSQGTS